MANYNETVEHVCEWMRNDCAKFYFSEGTRKKNGEYSDVHVFEPYNVADRILAAHEREMAAKDDARLTVVSNYENVIAAKDRIIAAKDAEIASLRSLVKEMADILKITARNYFECEDRICTLCGKKCGRNEATRLINMAREV